MSSIQVCIRMRPFLPSDEAPSERQRILLQQPQSQVKVELTEQREKTFKFNHVLGQEVPQTQLYSAIGVQKLVQRVVEGYHSTIFAYGQTGSGKTFTIEGGDSESTEGIIPRAIRDTFRYMAKREQGERGFRVYLSFIQIYNESIYDLIDPGEGRPLRMRWNKHQQFSVQNLFQCQCRSAEQALGWWRRGQRNKIMGSHKMNNASSRSHCMLTLRLQNYSLQDPSDQLESKLQVVDLAGSERYKATKSEGVVFREGIQINKSLFTLRQVIASLYETTTTGKAGLVPPYRDSKLTSLLKQSIGGNSYCLMIACLNPSDTHFEQSLQTLTYASMASFISNAPTLNVDPKVRQNEQLRQQVASLNKEIKKLEDHIKVLTKMLEGNECMSCKRRKDSNDVSQGGEAKEPLGIISLPKINEKIGNQNSFSQLHALNKEYLLNTGSISPKNSQASKKTLSSAKDIIQSIAMIRDLISSNSFFREKIEYYKQFIQTQEKEMFSLMRENQALREHADLPLPLLHQTEQGSTEPHSYAEPKRMTGLQPYKPIKPRIKTYANDSATNTSHGEFQSRSKISYNDFLKARNPTYKRQKKRLQSESKKDTTNDFHF